MRAPTVSHITAQATVPEQIISYVTAVGESRPVLYGECVAYVFEGTAALIAYAPGFVPDSAPDGIPDCIPDGDAPRPAENAVMENAVAEALRDETVTSLTVLGPTRPKNAPPNAAEREDAYTFLSLPVTPGQNLRNMLRRGMRECTVREEHWGPEHAKLAQTYIDSRPLEAGTRHIYTRIAEYLAKTPDAALFAARNAAGELLAVSIGDFSSLTTAFYMFAFRVKACPPGVADVLLHAIVQTATEKGHQFVNLGLGINEGIAAFKRKWGQTATLPCVQTSWQKASPVRENFGPDPLAVFTPPSFSENLRAFFTGAARPFDCVQIEVTSRCPGKCFYCPHTTKQAVWRSRTMEDATFAALAPLIKRAKRAHLQGWGEPLLHPRFFEYASAAARTGCAVSTTTYGLAVTEENAAKLVKSGIDIVAFSLTGVDETSNAARAGVPFAKVREGIAHLNKAKRIMGSEYPHIHLAYLMLASQEEKIPALPALMNEWDVPVAVVSTLDYIAAAEHEKEAYAPHEKEKIEHARVLLSRAAENAATHGRTIHYSLPGEHGRHDCNEHVQSCMYIDAEGYVAPCIYGNLPTEEEDLHRRVFGSVKEKKFMDIWNDTHYALFRKRLAEGNPDSPCVSCAKRFERVY
ncbi:MAG: PqqA peptide cyclase [Desulfovibrio sp.]